MSRQLDQALDLADVGVDIMRQNLHRRHPEATVEEIDRLLVAWQDSRPGAEVGDHPGLTRRLPDA